MSDTFVRLAGPEQTVWRFVNIALAMIGFGAAWMLADAGRFPLWLTSSPAIVAVYLVVFAILLDETETWVRPEGLTVRRRNLVRTVTHTAPASEIKGISVRPEWMTRLFLPHLAAAAVPLPWSVVIDTARHGRISGGHRPDEKDIRALEQRVRRVLGW